MYSLWNFFLKRRAFTILTMTALLVAGLYSLIAMPKESTPEIVVPVGIVTTVLPGATAADVERLVTDELEPAIRNVANIDTVTSSSRQGVSVINAQFNASADIETSIQDLRNAVELARRDLPSDAEVPTVTKIDFQNEPILIIGIGSDLAPETLTKLGEDLKNDLVSVEGVSKVEISGTRKRQVSVVIDQDALANFNIQANQVINALRSSNASLPAGTLTIDGIDYPIQFEGSIEDVETIANTPITTSSGTTIRISDIASIVDGFEKTSSISRMRVNGGDTQFALSLNVFKSSGGSILAVSDRVKDRLVELEENILIGSEATITYDAADEVRTSISDLSFSGMQTIILVMLVLFIAIGFYEALVAALAIPFSFVIAFIGMWVTGNSINFISLFSLIISIGILVDAGIVVVESIHTNREKDMSKMDAAQNTIRDFGWPLIAGVSTTIAVFVPLFFLSGVTGQFIQSIPFTIVVVLIASIVVALGFIPTIALGLIKHEESRLAIYREKLWAKVAWKYRTLMSKLFAKRKWQRSFFLFLTIALIGGLALPFTGLVKAVLFPPDDFDLFFVEIELPQATTLDETDAVARRVEELIADTPYMTSFMTTVGSQSVFNSNGGGSSAKLANITINLDEKRNVSSLDITRSVREKIADVDFGGAKVFVMDAAGGPPSGAPIVVKIWSDDTGDLAIATEQVERLVENTAGTRNISSSLADDGTELQVGIDRARAQEYGLSTFDIASTLQTAVAGLEATKIRIDGDDVEVRVMFNLNPNFINPEETSIATADSIAAIPVVTNRGTIPLGTLITISADRSSSDIGHEDGLRIGRVDSYVVEDANVVEVTNAIREQAEKLELPEGVRLTYGGDDEEIQKTFTEMLVALVAGLILMFSIVVLEFNTFRASFRLLAAIPLSLTGVLWGLFLMGQPLSFTAFLGIIALAGVMINHGILLLDAMNALKKENPKLTPEELVLQTAQGRVRPIILTTITTVIGMIPLIFVSSFWAPLAFTIAFGLIYGTVLTLVFIPLLSYKREMKVQKNK